MKLLDLPVDLAQRRQLNVWNDFINFTTAQDGWSSLAADTTVTVTAGDAAHGILAIDISNTDENEGSVFTTKEVFKFADKKTMVFETKIGFTAATTANVAVGFTDAVGANLMQDAGAGPKASGSMAIIYRQDDAGTKWRCRSQIGAAVGKSDSLSSTAAGGDQVLKIEVKPVSSTVAEITYWCDGVQLKDDTTGVAIKHLLTYTNATEMQAFVYAKTGGSAALVVNVDYIAASQLRGLLF